MSRGGRTEQDLKMARGEGKAVKVRQLQSYDCGAACLGSVAGWYGVYWPLIKIRYLCGCTEEGISVKGIRLSETGRVHTVSPAWTALSMRQREKP